jgi:hypothetical protein
MGLLLDMKIILIFIIIVKKYESVVPGVMASKPPYPK